MTWKFDKKITKIFDDHIIRSVPGYIDGHDFIVSASKNILFNGSKVLDVGCSNGSLLKKIDKKLGLDISYYGIDISKDMITSAKKDKTSKRINFYHKDIQQLKNKDFDLVISYFTLQFVAPSKKINFLKNVYNKLNNNCYFLIFEKVIEKSGFMQNFLNLAYNDFKEKNQFSPEEIYKKTNSLRGVMYPLTREENHKNFRLCKFKNINLLYKNMFFEGYIMKK